MKTLKGIVLILATICIALFVLTFDAIVTEYFYVPLLLLILGSTSFMIVFKTPKTSTKKNHKYNNKEKFIEYLNKSNDFYETYKYALKSSERNEKNEVTAQIK